MHKRALQLESACNHRGETIAQQEAAIDNRHHAINELQSTIACLANSDADQKKIIAEQDRVITELQAQIAKLASHAQDNKCHSQLNDSQVRTFSCLSGSRSCC